MKITIKEIIANRGEFVALATNGKTYKLCWEANVETTLYRWVWHEIEFTKNGK
jgi:hypothetical protein